MRLMGGLLLGLLVRLDMTGGASLGLAGGQLLGLVGGMMLGLMMGAVTMSLRMDIVGGLRLTGLSVGCGWFSYCSVDVVIIIRQRLFEVLKELLLKLSGSIGLMRSLLLLMRGLSVAVVVGVSVG